MIRLNVCLVLLVFFFKGKSQEREGKVVQFEVVLNDQSFALGHQYLLSNGDSVSVETLRFYITDLELRKGGKSLWKEADSYHLMDASVYNSMKISIPQQIQGDELVFLLGTDSLTNVSGAMGGDLDPSKGMYWAWNSGYINFKIEGTSPVCQTRNHAFQFHLGGYSFPNATVQEVHLKVTDSGVIQLDLEALLTGIDLSKENAIMSPSRRATELSKSVSSCFRFKS